MKSWRGSNRDCKLGFFLPKMKQREENIENTKRRRIRIQSSSLKKSTPSFPLDLVQEILLNLPVKSVVRFRCVSKLWSSIITDPYFTNSFDTQSSRRLNLLTFFKKRDKLFVFSFPQQHQNSSESYSSQPLDSYQKKYTKYCSFSITSITESVHGLICFQNLVQRIIWNPSMRQFLTLPKPKSCKDVTVLFLGYDPIEGNHKVVCMPSNKTCHECWVLTLRSARESWRTIKTNHKHLVFTSSYGRCINGVLYYRAYIDETGLRSIIMSFDVRSEKFNMIKLPSNIQCIRCMLIPYQGRLACFDNDVMKSGITLWILEDAETHRWSCKHFHASLIHYDQSLKSGFKLDGITHTGELIYVPNKFFESFNILYFDPDRDSFRKVKFEGVVDDKFMRRNGLGNSRLHTFPNHIDTLVSL